ncbi:hypothetical protein KKC88_00790 [Patescibacteria group bacterium]|nr:hypothetical protein [Patescibacteria group bacterium]MBU1673750.1 hypothetical protein [Patescibacteria group bacterium]MBU1964090.1 hypothetical protein [Patescibacteria group bacterium]
MGERIDTPRENIPIWKLPQGEPSKPVDDKKEESSYELVIDDITEKSERALIVDLIDGLNGMIDDKKKSKDVNEIMEELRDRDNVLAGKVQLIISDFVAEIKGEKQIMASAKMYEALMKLREDLKKK